LKLGDLTLVKFLFYHTKPNSKQTNMKQILTVLFMALLSGCGKPEINLENEKQNIIKCWKDWGSKADAGDPGYYWSEDVVLMGPDSPIVNGKENFTKMLSALKKSGFKIDWDEPSQIEISPDGQMAYLFAKNKTTMTDSTGTARSNSNQALQVWKKDKDGNWRAAVNIMYPEIQQ
jgi:ketosteroid isomerase-like protein